jgi:hypothetical protein
VREFPTPGQLSTVLFSPKKDLPDSIMNNGITTMFEFVSLEILDGASKEKSKNIVGRNHHT